MSLTFTRIEIGDPERGRLLARSLATLQTPAGEDWLGRIAARGPGGGWEILLSGPRRPFASEWETTVVSVERELYRRTVRAEIQNADSIRRMVRALLWDRITVVMDEPCDSVLARQMEDVAWDSVARAGLDALEVRLVRWPSAWGDVRYVGTAERYDTGEPCVAWCGVVRTPADLARALASALNPVAEDDSPAEELLELVPATVGCETLAATVRLDLVPALP